MSISGIVQGLNSFQSDYFVKHRELFEKLSQGQFPEVLFITCSDSRIDPNLLTQTQPGELFIIRNVGNIIPAYGATMYAEGAAIEYAVSILGIKDIIICGHTHCAAVKGLLQVGNLREEMPMLYGWLKNNAESTRKLVLENYRDQPAEDLLDIAIQQNILTQLENLETYPAIRSKMHCGDIRLHGWIYKIETGQIFAYHAGLGEFMPPEHEAFPVPNPLSNMRSR